ncbi:hypothetical protein L1077_08650 [Pseudoalteromonas luteoviolacea]|uniref:hypothetical protein n=1 Tax=Pseudoalteromonas luteoviolacea TaxID=43657 RepID=UPI001F45ABF6|nr:hypothetical protein [Pseudoalteromonas luteoviolacea]MCF6439494.1 hypothetical protein [Pseudoalteromonas luteoviolacea]
MRRILAALLASSICLPAFANETTNKDWVTNTGGDEHYFAATVNNSDHVFGKYCYFDSEQCLYLLSVDITCDKGESYPVLVNAESGSLNVNLVCGDEIDEQNVMIFDDFDEIERTTKDSKQFGIAIPMESGQFLVSRFSLSGAKRSINIMTRKAEKRLAELSSDSEML